MDLCLIEYLEENNFNVEQIRKIQKKFYNKDDVLVIKKINSIYKIFGYANLDKLTINELIVNNINLLKRSDSEIICIAFSWLDTSLLSDAARRTDGINYNIYDRIYLRNLYLNSSINYKNSPISYNALTMSDSEFSNDYKGTINNISFYPSYESLVNLYGKGSTFEEKQKYINDTISKLSLKWFMDEYRKEREKISGSKSI